MKGAFRTCFVLFVIVAVSETGVFADDGPKLIIQPPSVTKEVGASLALACRPIVPNPNLVTQFEWRDPKNRRINERNSDSPIYVQQIPGDSGLSLIISRLTENQAGNYSCHANYANTEKITAVVDVKTYVDIQFVDAPENQYPIAGRNYYIKCKVKGNPSPSIDWNKNGKFITTNDKYVIMEDQLFVKNVTEADDGEYKCTAVVFATGQIKTRTIKVEVQVPPQIEHMAPISVIEGETASTICKATGKPPPKYKWIKENTRQDLSHTDRFGVKEISGDLIINRVEANDDSYYTCIAENPAGRANTTVKINVLIRPKIFELWNVTSQIHQETKIICKVRGRPLPKVTFRKLSKKVPFKHAQQADDRRITLETEPFPEKDEVFGSLIISNLNRTDDGLYECIAENTAGKAYKNGHIAVEFPPTFERTKDLPPYFGWTNKPGNLSCLPEAIPNATIMWRYGGIEIENSSVIKKYQVGAQSFLIVNAWQDERFYTTFECVARNKLGEATLPIRLKKATVPPPIPQVKPQTVTATTIKFNIIQPDTFDNLPLRSYTVLYKPERTLQWDMAQNRTWSFGAPYILENLEPEVTYQFKFAARNDVGWGHYNNFDSVTMPRRSEPAEPRFLITNHNIGDENSSDRLDRIVVSPYSDHYELRWNVPNDNGDPIQHYLIRYCVTEKINGEWHDSDCSEQIQQSVKYNNYQLDGLHPDTTYKIELRAHNAIGDSTPTQIRVKTARGKDLPVPMKSAGMSSSTIIGIVIGAILIVLIVVDITCFCVNRTGLIALLCDHSKSKQHDEEDPKLGREEREPLKQEPYSGGTPTTVEYDGDRVYSKSGDMIGKRSAV